jgi:small subunit ribosomal protein S6
MPKTNPDVQTYELTYILGEQTGPAEAQAKLEEITKTIQGLKGSVSRHELWGRRELAYPIKRNRTGFYTTLWMEIPPEQLLTFQAKLRFDESILRLLVTKAYNYAQPGNLYPVSDTEKTATPAGSKEEKSTAEAMLRLGSSKPERRTDKAQADSETVEAELPEEERLKRLDEKLGELLQEDGPGDEEASA